MASKREKVILLLTKSMIGKRKDAFEKWLNMMRRMRVNELLDKERKRYLLTKLDNILMAT